MADPVRRETHIGAPPELVYATIVDYAAYPQFFPEFEEVLVLDTEDDGTQVVEFTADYGKRTTYTLRIAHDAAKRTTSWTYVGGDLKNSEGGWQVEDDGKGGSTIRYRILVEVGFFVPKMISDRLISRNIPAMFEQLEAEVTRRQGEEKVDS